MDVVSSSDRLGGRPFGRIDPRREGPALLSVTVSKILHTAAIFWAYGVLKHLPLAVFLFFLKASASVVYVLLQKPLSSGKRISRAMWIRITQYSLLVAGTGVLWTLGLTLCGPLRTVLLWEHSDLALVSAVGALLTLGTPKGRGALFLMVGVLALLLFDNDHSSPPSEHPEGPHRSLVSHTIYWLLSFMGVPDHRVLKGGVALLLCGLCLSVLQKRLGRRLSVDVGGVKRLQALSTLVVTVMLVPWALVQFFTQEMVDWWSALPCLLVTSLCQVVDFYTCSVALSKVDHYRVARTSSLSSFLSACGLAALLWWHLPSDSVDHALSVGVVIGACLFVLATPSLTRPLDRSQGILIGYSPNGLPLYQDPPSLLRQLRGAFVKIMENPDSRRIFYFLVLNLIFTVIELLYGMWTNSLGLISDGFHMLFDCTALMMGLYASLMSRWKPTRLYSYGYGRVEVLSGFVNCLFLVVVASFVFVEAVHRLMEPPVISSERLLFVSVAGFLVNLIGLVAFSGHAHSHGGHGHSHDDHSGNANMRGMFLHVLADTMGSVSVIISSLLIQQFGWLVADPICSLFIAILILISVVPLLKDSADALLLATPDHEHVEATLNKLPMLDGVRSYGDAHFWHQSSDHKAGTIHVQVAPSTNEQKVIAMITTFLKSELGLSNLTLQIEKEEYTRCGVKLSYLKQLAMTTPPQVYVDHGPHVGQIKAI